MVVEHNVATMVMLSDSDGGSWQYWPSDEMTGDRTLNFGYMTVTLVSRESRVSYVKREFKVANTKDENIENWWLAVRVVVKMLLRVILRF